MAAVMTGLPVIASTFGNGRQRRHLHAGGQYDGVDVSRIHPGDDGRKPRWIMPADFEIVGNFQRTPLRHVDSLRCGCSRRPSPSAASCKAQPMQIRFAPITLSASTSAPALVTTGASAPLSLVRLPQARLGSAMVAVPHRHDGDQAGVAEDVDARVAAAPARSGRTRRPSPPVLPSSPSSCACGLNGR